MPGFTVERHGYISGASMAADIVVDMLANGFTQSFPEAAPFNKATAGNVFKIIMEASGTVDPLNASAVAEKQPWRVCIDVQGADLVFMHVATPLQLANDGTLAVERGTPTAAGTPFPDVIGSIGAPMGNTSATVPAITESGKYNYPQNGYSEEPDKGLIMRAKRVGAKGGASYPLSYRLSITNRGFWMGCWEDASTAEDSKYFNWVLVQRPVDRNTGAVLTTGKAPVFCVNSVNNQYYQFVVREQDILRPGRKRSAIFNENDSEGILNTYTQVSLSEDGKYIVTFPSRLNTSRYRYPHELDMMGCTSADVVSQYSDVPLTVYGESAPRTYKALHASADNNTGMRVLVLQQGGGIS